MWPKNQKQNFYYVLQDWKFFHFWCLGHFFSSKLQFNMEATVTSHWDWYFTNAHLRTKLSYDSPMLTDSGTRNPDAGSVGTEQRTKQAEYFKFQFSLMIEIPPGTCIGVSNSPGKCNWHQTLSDFLVWVAPVNEKIIIFSLNYAFSSYAPAEVRMLFEHWAWKYHST